MRSFAPPKLTIGGSTISAAPLHTSASLRSARSVGSVSARSCESSKTAAGVPSISPQPRPQRVARSVVWRALLRPQEGTAAARDDQRLRFWHPLAVQDADDLVGHHPAEAVAEEHERHVEQRAQRLGNVVRERRPVGIVLFREPRLAPRHAYRQKLDVRRQPRGPWPKDAGPASGIGKAEEAKARIDHRALRTIPPPAHCDITGSRRQASSRVDPSSRPPATGTAFHAAPDRKMRAYIALAPP